MTVRTFLAALIAATWLLGCQTLSGLPQQQADRQFASDEEFRTWFAFYYRDPHPEYLTSALHYMDKQRYLKDFPDVASVFLSRIFAANPAALPGWVTGWADLGPDEWNVILVGLWLSNTRAARELMAQNVARVKEPRQARLRDMIAHDPAVIDPSTAEVVDPRQINLIWAAYSATGDERYVHQVIGYVHLYGDEAGERRAKIGEAAIMTLANNTLQHEAVARICAQEDAANPDPKTRTLLKAMLSALAQLAQREGNSRPAH